MRTKRYHHQCEIKTITVFFLKVRFMRDELLKIFPPLLSVGRVLRITILRVLCSLPTFIFTTVKIMLNDVAR